MNEEKKIIRYENKDGSISVPASWSRNEILMAFGFSLETDWGLCNIYALYEDGTKYLS